MTYAELQTQAEARHLTILGGFHPGPEDQAPKACKTLLLLGPFEPSFWPAFTATPEWQDGQPDPMDRWSTRVIGAWADSLQAQALYPFGGPPFLPFFSWAQRTGRIHASPIMLLVHDSAGLFVSFRGALALQTYIDLPTPPDNPCLTCPAQPCRSACPVGALDGKNYDVPACKSYLDTEAGQDCMTEGCRARRACPVSTRHPRTVAQSAYHMTIFKG
ncbi:ferredoxin [Roseobacter weihaiensis]|uniref:ferredoxin n=1 Tax=Roseobacter weihaiensis TaxID=2763262 RepID=UPI001D0B6E97|nr:ferredoxin [Roseobacter sp. H9]